MRIREEEALRYLGAKGRADDATVALLKSAAARLEGCADPRHTALRVPLKAEGSLVSFGPFTADCPALATHIAHCKEASLFAATLGAEVDRAMARFMKLDVALAFAMQAAAASALECYCDDVCASLSAQCEREGLYLRPRFSPGYSGFSIEHQTDLLRALDAGRRIGLSETDTHMLTPLKSVTAVVGVTPAQQPCAQHKCALCPNLLCEYRKELPQ